VRKLKGPKMSNAESGRAFKKPVFSVGENVIAVALDNRRGKRGVVIKIVEAGPDLVYRYRVRLNDGTTSTFFGFELEKET
jgi:hypothetical protein